VCLPPPSARGISRRLSEGKIAPSLEILILPSDRFHKSVDWILRAEGHRRELFGQKHSSKLARTVRTLSTVND
jgi:hypothetical protein